jgi:hypothetical protein
MLIDSPETADLYRKCSGRDRGMIDDLLPKHFR